MNRQQKEAAVGNLAYEFGAAEAVYAVDYRGLTVAQISELRARLLENETTLKVVKNSVTKLAAEKAEVASISSELSGPTALAFVRGDAAASAKILNTFVKESNDVLELKGGLLNGNALSSTDVIAIAKLPSRETLVQQLVTLIASPISGTARTLNAILSAVPVQLQKIVDEGLIGGNAPAAEAPAASETTEAEASADAPTEAEAPAADADADAAPAADAATDSTEE
ncbi:MAG: 50S ribosomal protein L10 [Solirubrobacteraceae bacterium]|nr:50S ribosomal protein L10 [Solirubrobacteraceae bacterium]